MRNTNRALHKKQREEALKLEALRLQIGAGAEDIARGDFDAFLVEFGRPGRKRAAK